jgi:hypothetical protein
MANREIIDYNGTGQILPKYIPPWSQTLAYGSFSSTVSQTVLGANTPTAITYNTTEIAQFTSFSGSRIFVQRTGVYRFTYSIQLDKSGGGNSPCEIYIAINGTPVPRSGSQVRVAGQTGETFPFCEYILQLTAGQYIEVFFNSSEPSMTATRFPEVVGQYPEIPSIISNIQQIA